MLRGDKGIASLTLQGRLQSFLEKGPNLAARGPIPQVHHFLGPERKQDICSIPQPKTKREVHEFLGAAQFCRIWILEYSSLAKPLYEVIAGSGKDTLNWGPDQERVFQEIKRLLASAPALWLSDVRSFHL
jgi:hypothetical protein